MYDYGRGVDQNHQKAFKWYQLAALQGHTNAQINLGVMYSNGQGVAKDYVRAYKWFYISAFDGVKEAIHNRDFIEKKMTPAQIEQAKLLITEWKSLK